MENKSSNKTLRKANKEKNDEFYTQLSDIEKELRHYKEKKYMSQIQVQHLQMLLL